MAGWRRGGGPVLDRLIYFALLLLLVLTPLPYGAVEAWSTALWELAVFALLILWGVQVVIKGRLRIGGGWLIWPIVGLALVAGLQLLPLGVAGRGTITWHTMATSQALLKLVASLGFFLLFASFVNTDERRSTTVNLLLIVCVVIALVGIGQSFIGKTLWQRGSFGPFVNRNHFAGFLAMGAGLAGGMLLGRSVRRELLGLYGSGLLVLCAGIVLSASRGGVLAMAAVILFLALVALPIMLAGHGSTRGSTRARGGVLWRAVAALVIGTAAIAGSLFLVGPEGLVRNLAQTSTEIDGVQPLDERFSRRDIWRSTTRIIRDHPWFGVGLGAFPFVYPAYDQSSGAQRVEQTHNDYLQVLVDTGLAGGVLLAIFVFLLFAKGFKAAGTSHRRRRSIALGALSGCLAMVVHSFVDFNLQITANAQLFLALVALATPATQEEEEEPTRTAD